MTTAGTRLVALLGHPVAHSRSPAMMTHAFAALGLDAVYVACDVRPEALAQAVAGLRALGAAGANVTIPHKRAALALCDRVDPAARAIGAVNTLARADDGALVGLNTDAPGAARALLDGGAQLRGACVAVLGAGGSARAVAVGVAQAGAAEVLIAARRLDAAREVAETVTALPSGAGGGRCSARGVGLYDADAVAAFARASVVVQTTPLGMAAPPAVAAGPAHRDPRAEDRMLELLGAMPPGGTAMDLVYSPRETPWLRAARALGLVGVDGLAMLAHQGAESIGHWFRVSLSADVLRQFLGG